MRGVVLTRKLTLPAASPHLVVEVAADPGRAWELCINVGNTEVAKRPIVGAADKIEWQTIDTDLSAYAGREVTIRLFQNLLPLSRLRPPGVAHWKSITLK